MRAAVLVLVGGDARALRRNGVATETSKERKPFGSPGIDLGFDHNDMMQT
jgi:hypothetical protein